MRTKQPVFSIIIPTYNRPRQLASCLQALDNLDYPRCHFEVIVVDDGSDTPPEDVVAPFRERLDIALIKQMHAGPATARNTGAAKAKGDLLAFTDDDCQPASDWLQALAARFAKAPNSIIGGMAVNKINSNPYSDVNQLLMNYLYNYYNSNFNNARFLASYNLAVPTKQFLTIGGFNTTFSRAAGEDRELCNRWLKHGFQMIYAPEAKVYHAHTQTFRAYFRQHFNYGRGAFCFLKTRINRGKKRIKFEPLFFYLNLIRYPISQVHNRKKILLTALMIVSQVANTTGFFWESATHTFEKIFKWQRYLKK